MIRYFNYSRLNADGDPAPASIITVYDPPGQTATLATLFADADGITPKANPFTANTGTNAGYFFFYTEATRVDITFSGGGITTPYTWGDVDTEAVDQFSLGPKFCNILDYGAVGDGVTDDRAAIQAAITAAGIGGTVYIPETNSGYLLDSTTSANVCLDIDALRGIKLQGGGYRSCLLLGTNAGLDSHGIHIKNSNFYSIRDLSVGTKVAGWRGDGIRIGGSTTPITKLSADYATSTNRSHYGVIENCWGCGPRWQISALAGQSTRVLNSKIQAPSSQPGPYTGMQNTTRGGGGIYVNSTASQCHGFQATSCVIEGVGSWGVYMYGVLNGKIVGGTLEGSGDGGVQLNIASSTNASPIEITTATPHDYITGQQVYIAGHTLNTDANGIHSLTVVSTTKFTLDGSVGTAVGGATGTTVQMQGDLFMDNCVSCTASSVYSETGTTETRNYLINGGRQNALVDCLASGGYTHVESGLNHTWRNLIANGVIVGASVQGLKAYDFEYASSGTATFLNNAGNGVQVMGTITNGSNTNRQFSGIRESSPINYVRNGGMERWVSATSMDAVHAGAYSVVAGATLVRCGDNEADTTKYSGRYCAKVTAHAVNPSSGLQYQGPVPRYVSDPDVAVTVSVWAKAASGTALLGIGLNYSTGAIDQVGHTVTTTWTKYSASFKMRTGATYYSPTLYVNTAAAAIYFDDLFVTDGLSEQLGDWDNAKLNEVEPQGVGVQTFSATPIYYGDTATVFKTVLTGSITGMTFTGFIPGQTYRWLMLQDGVGGRTVAWTGPTINWVAATAPVTTVTADVATLVTLFYDGTEFWEVNRNLNLS